MAVVLPALHPDLRRFQEDFLDEYTFDISLTAEEYDVLTMAIYDAISRKQRLADEQQHSRPMHERHIKNLKSIREKMIDTLLPAAGKDSRAIFRNAADDNQS